MTLALIAGSGALPHAVAGGLTGQDWTCFHLEGYAPDGITSEPFRVERLGSFIADLKGRGVTEVCFAGAIARPRLDATMIDAATMPLAPRMMQALQAGDDAALRIVLAFFEEAGITILAAQDVAPALLDVPVAGEVGARDAADIDKARAVHAALSDLDIGQGCVVAGGQVLAVETTPGTDWMLASLTAPFARPNGGVLFKSAKRGQDRRVDIATIGPETVTGAARAGLSGIAVVQGSVIVLEPDSVRARLKESGLFLTTIAP
ncbi:hypothetical protein SAMN05444004_11147 [Jannaschia faecimaris]|uniref:Phosphatidate cytidylyltransferase n=1 Tax=Jannaschia faecimaris TaxID=1244108 RepID=A0A1H3SAU9_9RHOB|nr:UDP-2,3-diacylglucosamine diphosphatase LpxI [Jannaschia faecimaris]SDZ34830.1 hypothetical protein SAMN05444004_11147 [Jannaschia faecimaris]